MNGESFDLTSAWVFRNTRMCPSPPFRRTEPAFRRKAYIEMNRFVYR